MLNKAKGHHVQIYSKIQSQGGLINFEEILTESDGIIIARGYLGMSLEDFEDVVFIQRYITKMCNTVGKPVILQTQIMQSM
jgi:pyruvate kinase